MSTLFVRRRWGFLGLCGVRLGLLLAMGMLLPGALQAATNNSSPDERTGQYIIFTRPSQSQFVRDNQELAKAAAMHDIAVLQAERGDVTGAKTTLDGIGDKGPRKAADVTSVWFVNGQPVYDHPPQPGLSPARPASVTPLYRPGYNYDGTVVPGFWVKDGRPVLPAPAPCAPACSCCVP